MWCIDERHDTPCPQPCAACADEGCDPPVGTDEAMAAFPDLDWPDAIRIMDTLIRPRFPHESEVV